MDWWLSGLFRSDGARPEFAMKGRAFSCQGRIYSKPDWAAEGNDAQVSVK